MKNFGIVRAAALVVFGMLGADAAFAQGASADVLSGVKLPEMPAIKVDSTVLNKTEASGVNVIGKVTTLNQGDRGRATTKIDLDNDNDVRNKTDIDVRIGGRVARQGLPISVPTTVVNDTVAQGANQIDEVITLNQGDRGRATTTIDADNDNRVKNDTKVDVRIGRQR